MLWRQDALGTLLKHFAGLWALAEAIKNGIQWCFKATENTTKQSVMSWTGDSRVLTKGDLSQSFAEATSVQKGDTRLVLKSDLDGLEQRVKSDLDGLEQRLNGKLFWLFFGSYVLHGVTLWSINNKK